MTTTTNNTTKAAEIEHRNAARTEQRLRELASDLCALVEQGDMTEQEANEWLSAKQDEWSAES